MADDKGKTAKDWELYFRMANVRAEDLEACKSSKAKTIKIGRFLSPNVGRAVPIEVKGRTGKAVLCVEEGRSKEKRYYFAVQWDDKAAGPKTDAKQPPAFNKRATKGTKATTKNPAAGAKEAEAAKAMGTTKHETEGKRKPVKGQTGNEEDW